MLRRSSSCRSFLPVGLSFLQPEGCEEAIDESSRYSYEAIGFTYLLFVPAASMRSGRDRTRLILAAAIVRRKTSIVISDKGCLFPGVGRQQVGAHPARFGGERGGQRGGGIPQRHDQADGVDDLGVDDRDGVKLLALAHGL